MSYLLFVRASSDLDRACREVSGFFALQNRRAAPVSHTVCGVWIEPTALQRIPLILSRHASEAELLVRECYGVSGIWQLGQLVGPPAGAPDAQVPDAIIESLRRLDGEAKGRFAPVFSGRVSRAAVDEEWLRLRRRYPAGLAPPLVQDPNNGALQMVNDLSL